MKFIRLIVFGIILFQSCKPPEKINYFEISLESGWMFRNLANKVWYPGHIPGNILQDLFTNKIIDDPRLKDNINTLSWVQNEDWEYQTEFDLPEEILNQESILLNFEGIFPNADIFINDSLVQVCPTFLSDCSIMCKNILKAKQNKIRIHFSSPYRESKKAKNIEEFSCQNTSFIPSALFCGSRVSPELFNLGILRPVKLIAWTDVRIRNVYFVTDSINKKSAYVSAVIEIESSHNSTCELTVDVNNAAKLTSSVNLKKGVQIKKIEIQIDNPDLWWCNGMGNQPLYSAIVGLQKERYVISKKAVSFGIRKIELITQSDSSAFGFYFRLNNKPVFIKGTTILPAGIYQLEEDVDLYERMTSDAVSANINMFRMWGGGVYESPEFYELCNKKGILIWQDLIISPDTFKKNDTKALITYILEQIKHFQNNSPVALCYASIEYQDKSKNHEEENSEILQSFNRLNEKPGSNFVDIPVLFHDLKIKDTEELQADKGTEWSLWYEGAPLTNIYKNKSPFIFEYGFQSLPEMLTIATFTDENDYNLRSPILAAHQFDQSPRYINGLSGTQLISNYIQMYYNEPNSFESFVYLSQIFQAQALKFTIEALRAKQPQCMGSIFWHFNDCWPSISWSVIDNYNRLKPAYYSVKNAYKNMIIIPELNQQQEIVIRVVNDSSDNFTGEVNAQLMDFNGNTQFQFNDTVHVKRNLPCVVFSKKKQFLVSENQSNKLLLYVSLSHGSKTVADNILYFCDPSFLDLPVPDLQLKISDKGNGYLIIFNSETLVKNVVLSTINNGCRFSDNNFDILPGKTKNVFAEYSGSLNEFEEDLQSKSLIESY